MEKKNKKICNKKVIGLLIFFIMILLLVLENSNLKMSNINTSIRYDKYTDGYEKWLSLSEEEKQLTIEPPKYAVPKSTHISTNPLNLASTTNSQLESKFTLKDVIPENLVIKDQKNTPSCWAYATLASLETNLALKDKKNNATTVTYDFSEMHMEYATTRTFLNDEINKKGYNVGPFQLGNFERATAYLTNGFGAINESSMPFEKYCKGCTNSADYKINLSEIMDKQVTAQVNDVVEFPTYEVSESNVENIENLKIQLKNHIKNHGGVAAGSTYTNILSSVYNYDHAAVYCNSKDDCPMNHSVTIVGWDDNFATTNFGSVDVPEEERLQPSKPGAWIVKNSYGTDRTFTFEQIRNTYCTVSRLKAECEENGWDADSSLIPEEKINELIDYNKFISNGDGTYTQKRGGGYLYISYEDVNIYTTLFGIENASSDITYDNIYQYNDLGWNYNKSFATDNGKLYLANVFNKQNPGEKEYLTQVSISVPETNTVSVYVNSNGSSLNKDDLQLVELKAGKSETFSTGYHTLEFLNPIEITSDEFAVVLEIKKDNSSNVLVRLEGYQGGYFEIPGIANGTSFYSTNMTDWESFSDYALTNARSVENNYIGADTTIKAFTISEIESIEIVSPPSNTTYIEGDDFDTSGMVVELISKDGTRIEITDYVINNGSNLQFGQESITISYLEKTATQAITVEKNTVESLKITKEPTITNYIEGQTFNSKGMIVTAYYKNGTSVEITNYKIVNGDNLTPDKKNITVSYEENDKVVTTTQEIIVKEKTLQSITLDDSSVKKSYIEGQDFDPTGLKVTANYEYLDVELTVDKYKITNGEDLKLGVNEIVIEYEENGISKQATIEIEVIEKEVVSIFIETPPTKINYIEGQNFVPEGMIVKAKFNDNEEKDITDYITVFNGTSLKMGQKNVTISYQNHETTQDVIVTEKQIEKISIKELPTKKTYIQNKETLDLTGGTITVTYDNGLVDIVEMTSDTVEIAGFDNSNVGSNTLTLTYGEKTLSFSVEIIEETGPQNSNFENALAKFKSIKAYYYTTSNKENYVLMDTEISQILKNKENDNLEYYYYLSSNQKEQNIDNWIRIKETQNVNSDILTFTIDTKDISNYNELSNSDVLYLYIKEVASKGSKQSTIISQSFQLKSNVEIEKYVDDIKDNSSDETIDNPKTGVAMLNITIILGLILVGFVCVIFINRRLPFRKL